MTDVTFLDGLLAIQGKIRSRKWTVVGAFDAAGDCLHVCFAVATVARTVF